MARVGVTNIESYIRGVTSVDHIPFLVSIISTGEFSSRSSFIIAFSSPVDSTQVFRVDHILFLGSSVLLACLPLASLSFRSAQHISGDSSVFQLIRGCHLILIILLFRCIIYLFNIPSQRCYLFSGP